MSKNATGELALKCDVNVLIKALKKVFPQWASHIHAVKNGKIYDYQGNQITQDIGNIEVIIPGTRNPNYQEENEKAPGLFYNDIGFFKKADGNWAISADDSGFDRAVEKFVPGLTGGQTIVTLDESRDYRTPAKREEKFSAQKLSNALKKQVTKDELKNNLFGNTVVSESADEMVLEVSVDSFVTGEGSLMV